MILTIIMRISNFMQKSPVVPLIFIGQELQSNLGASLQKINLNIIDALVLVSIFFEERLCKPSEIATNLDISRSQVSQSLKRLEFAGLIERTLNKTDSRISNLRITVSGKNRSIKVIKIFDEITEKIELILSEKFSENLALRLINLKKDFVKK